MEFDYNILLQLLVPLLIAFIVVYIIYPYILKMAFKTSWMDNPDPRKQQKKPIPVLGGLTVFIGMVTATLISSLAGFFTQTQGVLLYYIGFVLLIVTGMLDDKFNIKATIRLLIEITLILAYISITGIYIDDLQGFLGIGKISEPVAITLSVIAGVGLINAINMIDGINGLSSGFSMLTLLLFSRMFYAAGSMNEVILSLIAVGSLIPFFLHNVFGKKSKMFIGDAGTMMFGYFFSLLVFSLVSSKGPCIQAFPDISMAAFALAGLGIPVFDTLRVMGVRIYKKRSPFSPDKTHLHHLFLDLGCSHIGATICVLLLNFFIVLAWVITYKLGASVTVQLLVTGFVGFMNSVGFYFWARRLKKGDKVYNWLKRFFKFLLIEETKSYRYIRSLVDKGVSFD